MEPSLFHQLHDLWFEVAKAQNQHPRDPVAICAALSQLMHACEAILKEQDIETYRP